MPQGLEIRDANGNIDPRVAVALVAEKSNYVLNLSAMLGAMATEELAERFTNEELFSKDVLNCCVSPNPTTGRQPVCKPFGLTASPVCSGGRLHGRNSVLLTCASTSVLGRTCNRHNQAHARVCHNGSSLRGISDSCLLSSRTDRLQVEPE